MEDKKLNEKESLELITQMIQNTRRNLDTGSGNMFLVWGYVSVLVTLTVLGGCVLYKESSLDVGILGNSRYRVFTDISFDA